MGQGYFAKQDVITRLHGTVCMYQGEPVVVWVNPEAPADQVDIVDLKTYDRYNPGKKKRTVSYTDDTFDYKAMPLGYAWVEKRKAVYISRLPDRQQSQGLSQYVIRITSKSEGDYISHTAPYMYDCIKGNYPSASQAISLVSNGAASSVPFDRRFAIGQVRRGVVTLQCRGKDVGLLQSGERFKLFAIKEAPLIVGALKGKLKVH